VADAESLLPYLSVCLLLVDDLTFASVFVPSWGIQLAVDFGVSRYFGQALGEVGKAGIGLLGGVVYCAFGWVFCCIFVGVVDGGGGQFLVAADADVAVDLGVVEGVARVDYLLAGDQQVLFVVYLLSAFVFGHQGADGSFMVMLG
jgi:hypothetical protein